MWLKIFNHIVHYKPFKNGKALISNGNSDYYYLYKNGEMIYDSTLDY